MPNAHDPAALLQHAVKAGDWRLVELIARTLGGQQSIRRAYSTLVVKLGLMGGLAEYDRD